MLKQRMITAAWLAPVTLIGLFGLQGGAFALFTALIVLLGTWEWTNLAGVIVSRTRLALVAGMAVLMALLWLSGAAFAVWPLWLVAEPLLGDALPGKQSAVASHFTPSTHGRLGTAAVLGRF